MDFGRAIRLIALRNVIRADADYTQRYILRWYSEKFHTPLHVVETLPFKEVLLTYYESVYENMKDEDRKKEIEELLETDEQRQEKMIKEDREAAEAESFARLTEVEEEKKSQKKQMTKVEEKKKFEAIPDPRAPRPLRAAPKEVPDIVVEAPKQSPLQEIPPDIRMSFADLGDEVKTASEELATFSDDNLKE